jgi:hypothetical protein
MVLFLLDKFKAHVTTLVASEIGFRPNGYRYNHMAR